MEKGGNRFDYDRLVSRCIQGDDRAWVALVQQLSPLAHSVALQYRLDTDACADVVQQTFLALYAALPQISDPRYLPRWTATTAARHALRLSRLSSRSMSSEDLAVSLDEQIADDERTAEQQAVVTCEAESVHNALRTLGEPCRELLTILFVQEGSYDQVHDKMGMALGSIGPTKHRCLQKLKKILQSEDFF